MFDRLHDALDAIEAIYWRVRHFFGYKPLWDDLSDVILEIEPDDTPFLTSIKRQQP